MSGNTVTIDLSRNSEDLRNDPEVIKTLSAMTADTQGDTYIKAHTDAFAQKIITSEAQYTTHLNALEKAPSDPVALSNVQRSLSALQMMINAQTNAIKKFTDNAMAIINNFR
nr:EscF/YscF/HrpA family type III secretion system needle major subunit [Candidatus Hamiltonella defensa]